jgi:hypothetical protein
MKLPAANCRESKLIRFYPLTLTLSPRRGSLQLPCSELQGIFKLKREIKNKKIPN